MNWLADAATDPTSAIAQLGQYGVAGVIAVIFLMFAWKAYNRETKRADENAAEIQRLNTIIQDKHIPALQSATQALIESTQLLAEFRARRRT